MERMDNEPPRYRHEFSDEELNMMMYLWDEKASATVQEYLYMKKEWRHMDNGVNQDKSALTKDEADGNVYFELDTQETVHIIEFYAPWCPHCLNFKNEYIDLSMEVPRRAVGTPVEFHAISCELFRVVCRSYGVKDFPVVVGYPIGSDITKPGIELNPVDEPDMSANSMARALGITLLEESVDVKQFNNSDDRKGYEADKVNLAVAASDRIHSWHTYPSTMDERYHNAAVSLVFLLKDGVYTETGDSLDDTRGLALKAFLELLDWTTPQSWCIRTGLIRSLLDNLPDVLSGHGNLVALVDQHLGTSVPDGSFWGALDCSGKLSTLDSPQKLTENMLWTEACSHGEAGLGYSCGLWNLFHIVSIGASLPDHQLYGFHSGYLTSPADVADIVKRLIDHFFGCRVCRRNFVANYEACGQNHCERLVDIMPALTSNQTEAAQWEVHVELARWLMEMHNAVNKRLMAERAQREDRVVTLKEEQSAIFPPMALCEKCWNDENMTTYEPYGMIQFLQRWYWPVNEAIHMQFHTTLTRRTNKNSSNYNPNWWNSSLAILAVACVAIALWMSPFRRRRGGRQPFKMS